MSCGACDLYPGMCPECRAAQGDSTQAIDQSGSQPELETDGGNTTMSTQQHDTEESAAFEAITTADALQEYVATLTTIVEEAKFHVTPDGLHSRAVDPANVAMVDTTLSGDAFDSFEVLAETTFGVNLDRLSDVIGWADADELIRLQLDAQTRKLHLSVGPMEYSLACIDPESVREEPDLPDLDLSTQVTLTGAELSRALKGAGIVHGSRTTSQGSGHVTIQGDAGGEAFVLDAQGDTDSARLSLGQEELLDARIPENVRSRFSLDYLEDLSKPIGSDTEVEIHLGDELPFKLFWGFAEGHGQVENMLAPRVDSEGA